jgi:hypothetical protein
MGYGRDVGLRDAARAETGIIPSACMRAALVGILKAMSAVDSPWPVCVSERNSVAAARAENSPGVKAWGAAKVEAARDTAARKVVKRCNISDLGECRRGNATESTP